MSDNAYYGRYDPKFCDRVVALGKKGKSRVAICADLGFTRRTVYLWIERFPEFKEAMDLAKTYEHKWWEDRGQENLSETKFQGGVWSKNMSARFKEDWSDRQEITGANGGPLKAETKTTIDPESLTDEQLRVIAGIRLNRE